MKETNCTIVGNETGFSEHQSENEMSTRFHEARSTIRQLTTNPSSQKYIFGTILSRQSYVLAKEIYSPCFKQQN